MSRCLCGQDIPQGWDNCPYCGQAVEPMEQSPSIAIPARPPLSKLERGANIAAIITILVVIIVAVSVVWISVAPPAFLSSKPHVKNPTAVISTSMGDIKIVLYKDKVPNTVDNFVKYAKANFYEGLIFHRVTNLDSARPTTHIIQGGGFNATMVSKEALYPPIALEIIDNLTHVDGAVAMARTSDIDSATSQFYFCDGDQHFLDDSVQRSQGNRGYAVFGKVTSGMEIVRAMGKVQTDYFMWYSDVPVNPIIITSVTIQ